MDGMTTLMVLMAGLAMGSDGTERNSAETEQRLGIWGYWEGIEQNVQNGEPNSLDVELAPGWFSGLSCKWFDESGGKCRFIVGDKWIFFGIYKRESGRLVICYVDNGHDRPTRFQPDGNKRLLILKPAKPPGK
jgi:hypothetical protein